MNAVEKFLETIELGLDDIAFEGYAVNPEDTSHIPADDAVSLYFRQMASEPLLTREQEIALAKRVKQGVEAEALMEEHETTLKQEQNLRRAMMDAQAARQHFARANTRLVISIAKRYRNQGLPMSDLIQEGNVGLMLAVDKFDHTMGNRFSTYASWWIRQSITRALSQKSRTIRIPLHITEKLRRIGKARRTLSQELGHDPSINEIASHLGIEPHEVEEIMDADPQTIALEAQVGTDGDEIGDFIEDESFEDLPDLMEQIMLTDQINDLLADELMPREAEIIRLRFGLNGGVPQTLEQVGKVIGLSRERVRQIEQAALRRLRHPRIATLLHNYTQG